MQVIHVRGFAREAHFGASTQSRRLPNFMLESVPAATAWWKACGFWDVVESSESWFSSVTL